jgi:hypothetical protein
MGMSLEEFVRRFPSRPKPIPAEYAGQWIAWDTGRTQIVAHGPDRSEVRRNALAAGHPAPILQKVPRGPFLGVL